MNVKRLYLQIFFLKGILPNFNYLGTTCEYRQVGHFEYSAVKNSELVPAEKIKYRYSVNVTTSIYLLFQNERFFLQIKILLI